MTYPENPSGATFPDLNDPATLARLNLQLELTTALGGAVATVQSFTADGLFNGQPESFFDFAMQLATAADNALRQL